MKTFQLHPKLQEDTHLIFEHQDYLLLLHKNAHIPWFIIVPKTEETELYRCPVKLRQSIEESVNYYARAIETYFHADKLNIATIGNIVSQLHIHIIARYQNDIFWPAPVWGQKESKAYHSDALDKIKSDFKSMCNKYI